MAENVTIRDIARQCGVSPATVSRVLSQSDYPVRQSVREKVLEAAKELNYIYTPVKKPENLAEVAVLVPTTANPFYTSIIDGVERSLVREGFNVLIYNMSTGMPKNKSERILNSLLAKKLCGLVVASSNNTPLLEEGVLSLVKQGMKVVLVDSPRPDARYNCVSFDYERGSYIGTEYLISKNHRDIVYAGLKLERESRHLRVKGFRNALESHGLPFGNDRLLLPIGDEFDESSQIEAGEELSRRIMALPKAPTAVAAVNDLLALGLLRGFNKQKVRVPEDISIIGFDDSIFSELSYPALTTVRVQAEQMGQMAAMLLLEDMRGGQGSLPVNLFLDPAVVERGTVASL